MSAQPLSQDEQEMLLELMVTRRSNISVVIADESKLIVTFTNADGQQLTGRWSLSYKDGGKEPA